MNDKIFTETNPPVFVGIVTHVGIHRSLTFHKQQMEGGYDNYDSEPKRSSDPGSKLPVHNDT